jgi:hypothetical protein
LQQAVHDLVDPTRVEKSLVADQKNLMPPEPARTGPYLSEELPAENNLGDFKFAMAACKIVFIHPHFLLKTI